MQPWLTFLFVLMSIGACAHAPTPGPAAVPTTAKPVATAHYLCEQNKTITAEYFNGPTRTAPNGQPIPGGRVDISLSDGRKLSLPQTLSGSGIRYANADESFVFWSKGDTAFVEEGKAMTYTGCVAAKS